MNRPRFILSSLALILAGCQPGPYQATSPVAPQPLPPVWTETAAPLAPSPSEASIAPINTAVPVFLPVSRVWRPCIDGPLSQLHPGDYAYVAHMPPVPNNVRDRPEKNEGTVRGQVGPGQAVYILSGPVCDSGLVWWEVQQADPHLQGWMAEGDEMAFWLIPTAEPSEPGPVPPPIEEVAFSSPSGSTSPLLVVEFVLGPEGAQVLRQREVGGGQGWSTNPSWSPDGAEIAFISSRAERDGLYLLDISTNNVMLLSDGPWNPYRPAWSPDGTRLAFVCGGYLCLIDRDGSNLGRIPVSTASGGAISAAWSPDGTTLALAWVGSPESGVSILDLASGQERVLPHDRQGPYVEALDWSPNGEWLVVGGVYGDLPLFLISPEDGEIRFLDQTGREPSWSPDGSWVVYEVHDPTSGLRVLNVAESLASRGKPIALTEAGVAAWSPSWRTRQGPIAATPSASPFPPAGATAISPDA